MRMTGLNEKPGYAATGKVNLQLADLGTVRLSGSMHTEGYGNIDQKLNQRQRDDFYQYDASTNLNMGKLMPRTWGVQLPLFVGYSESVSNPQYNPYDLDVKLKDQINAASDKAQKDSIRKVAQDFTSITSVNLTNVRVMGNPEKQTAKRMPWSIQNFDFSYAYNKQHKRNPLIESDNLINNTLGIGYTYSLKTKAVEPFKKMIKSKSKWFSLVKDFNFKPLPTNFTFRTDLRKIMDETQVRNISDGPYKIEPTYYKNFTWDRSYVLRWELTNSLSLDYTATNRSRVDEPYGRVNTKEKKDSLLSAIGTLGRNVLYQQSFNTSYNVPVSKLPLLDWTSLRASYGSTYTWTAASQLARSLGNTIANTQDKKINAEFNFTQLYNKNRYLRAINQPKPRKKNGTDISKPASKTSATMLDSKGSKDGKGSFVADNKTESPTDNAPNPEKPKEEKKEEPKKKEAPKKQDKNTVIINGVLLSTLNFTDKQVDSLRGIQKAQEEARLKAEKEKRKRDRIAARKARRAKTPEIAQGVRVVGRLLTMVKRVTVNYSQTGGTILPGYLDSTRYMGTNNFQYPGLDFVYGSQPNRSFVESYAANGKLSTDSLFNSQFQQNYAQTLNANATLEPFPDFRIDLTLSKTFSKTHSELFKDSTFSGKPFEHLNPYETGSFNISYIALKTMFKSAGANSAVYNEFLENRKVISHRLGSINPYTNNTPDPNDPEYSKGYTKFSQDVLIPAFIAAYSGKDPSKVALVDYSNSTVQSNPFKYYFPMPNWRISYNGLTKLPIFSPIFNNFVINHSYSGTMSLNSFVSAMFYQDMFALGAPSFIDSSSGNYVPFYQVPNLTISEQFSPLLGVDAALKNNVSAKFEYRKSRTVSLSLIDYQVSETKSSEIVIGAGYRVRGLNLPFEILGVRKLKNDLNIKVDLGFRDDKTSNNYLAQNIEVTTRGQKVVTISPTVDYVASDKLTIQLYYDRRQSIPYTTQSFPITTTRAGIRLRFIFAN